MTTINFSSSGNTYLNENIQARYVWKYVLGLDGVDQKLKDKISQKLIFGINNNL